MGSGRPTASPETSASSTPPSAARTSSSTEPATAVVPPNDWEEPDPPRPYESSAAAIAASGLWQLADLTADPAACRALSRGRLAILTKLSSPDFLALDDPAWEGILRHGVYHERRGLGVDESVMWGDYFFVEALDRVLESARNARS